MVTVTQSEREQPTAPGAATPSPFTPIANYGFLSNCHTGALVAPDGTVDWLCVPRFDSPSVFGALLDRGAGGFRFAPFGINVPMRPDLRAGNQHARDVVEDAHRAGWSCATRSRWDRAAGRTRSPPTRGRRPTRTPTTRSCGPPSASTARSEIDLVCEPAFDYGRVRRRVDAQRGSASSRGRPAPSQALRLQTDMLLGIEAGRARARHVLRAGETVYCALAWSEEALVPDQRRGGRRTARGHDERSGATGSRARRSPTTSSGR